MAVKGYLRKGSCLMAMKEASKAAVAYQKALDLDPKCQVGKRIHKWFSLLLSLRLDKRNTHLTVYYLNMWVQRNVCIDIYCCAFLKTLISPSKLVGRETNLIISHLFGSLLFAVPLQNTPKFRYSIRIYKNTL